MRACLLLLLPLLLLAANVKLYLRDGEFHLVREYRVVDDRVRFFSAERGDWEEIPIGLVDLKRTEREIQDKAAADKEKAQLIDEEEKAERDAAREVASVPQNPGIYFVDGKTVKPMQAAETKMNNNKRRSVLAAISPIPMITGKATVELDGETSLFTVNTELPEFYFRLSQPERFGLVKLARGKGVRIVEKLTIVPVSKEVVEEREQLEVFRRQVGEDLYKVWPMEPLAPGEYAAVQFTEGKVNMQVWDFTFKK
ncbi:MAG: hypothetical protein JNK48_03705 [Bryobacterales bacterium]|nr:hypothetical protein [Bryobacterales bacterium]